MASLGLNVIGVLGTLIVIPESPKFLYAKGRIQECIQKIQYIARINGKGAEII